MNQRERLDEIKNKHKKEQIRRKILIHRIIVAVAVFVILAVIVFAVRGLVSAVSERNERKRQEEAAIAAQTPVAATQPPVSNEIDQSFYTGSAFVGNSFIEGMIIYDLVEGADYFSKVGLTVDDALEADESGKSVIDGLSDGAENGQTKMYSRIFVMFGENELGWVYPDTFYTEYGKAVDKIKEYQPMSNIYLLAITPVTKAVSDKNEDNTTNERINEYNELIKKLASEKGVNYADIYSATADETGALPEGAASDGVHFGEDYYKKCLIYIQNTLR